jgi:hypothetical protein
MGFSPYHRAPCKKHPLFEVDMAISSNDPPVALPKIWSEQEVKPVGPALVRLAVKVVTNVLNEHDELTEAHTFLNSMHVPKKDSAGLVLTMRKRIELYGDMAKLGTRARKRRMKRESAK